MALNNFQKGMLIFVLLALSAACLPGFNLTIGATHTPQVSTATIALMPTATALTGSMLPPTLVPSATALPGSRLPPTPIAPTAQPASGGLDRVNIYLVAVDDNGVSGKLIGCGDSLVPVEVRIAPTLGVLRAALAELLKLEGKQYYGESGLYNALYQSHLTIEDVAVIGREARIFLKGNLALGGECDNPRAEEQLKALALQFNTVDQVSVFINGEPLANVIDLKG